MISPFFSARRIGLFVCLIRFISVQLVLLATVTDAHPGAVADGRATCGSEYSTPETAYLIPDFTDSWYLRRISTCESPVFWAKWEITEDEQQIYIAAISPEIDRFEDDIQFHAILYGPGIKEEAYNGLSAIPDATSLPDGIRLEEDLLGVGAGGGTPIEGAAYATHTIFNSCDFVKTNPVMKNFAEIIDGRCMENFSLDATYKDPLQQDTVSLSWWLYSFNHEAREKGTYYLQTWITTRDDNTTVAQGKYEMTLGPHIWYDYASDSTLELAQSQGTSCSCAVNALDYKESYLERLGDLDEAFEVAQLPGGSCSSKSPPKSSCVTIPQKTYMSKDSATEWSGLFELKTNHTYEWTFHSYYQGSNLPANISYGYPDPGMYVHIVTSDDVASIAEDSDNILQTAVKEQGDSPSLVVKEGEVFDLESGEPQFILFTDPTTAKATTVLINVTSSNATLAIFTQHVPSEFMAHALKDVETKAYVFPTESTLYVEGTKDDSDGGNAAIERKTHDSESGKNDKEQETDAETDADISPAMPLPVTSGASVMLGIKTLVGGGLLLFALKALHW